ncbi:MAG TPA: amidase, partial [Actinomycetota bacterium]|nr:amidase [Actinomycetota bacterium]
MSRSSQLCDRPASELAERLRVGEIRSTEIAGSCLERIAALEPRLGAFLLPTEELARRQAAEVEERIASGSAGAVTGIPVALKDVLSTRGVRTTCGSKILETYVPPYDCTPWARLAEAGSVLLGKTNCDEFAMGSSNENSA